MPLEDFTLATFEPLLGERFELSHEEHGAIALELANTRAAPGGDDRAREPFALLFHGPREPLLPQRIYALSHPQLGAFELFLVPVAQDAEATSYEAVFG